MSPSVADGPPRAIELLLRGLGLDLDAAGEFMTRRYGAAGALGLGVALWLSTGRSAPSAVLGGVSGWFLVQGGVVIAGLATGTVAGLAWLPVITDPVLGVVALVLAIRLGPSHAS